MINVEEHLGLVHSVARQFKSLEYDDAFQSGCEGLIVASQRYDSKREDVAFSTFARIYISGYINNYIKSSQLMRKPTKLKKLNKEIKELVAKGLSLEEISVKIQQPVELVEKAYKIYQDVMPLLDDLVDEEKVLIDDFNLEQQVEHNLEFESAIKTINKLSKKQREIIIQRFYYGKTQAEVAKEKNRTRQAIQFTEKKALKILKESLT